MPLPMVFATWVPSTNAATKLNSAAHTTACCGDSTRVETTVAIEFAASWKPFRKSNDSATRMMPRRASSVPPTSASGVLNQHVADDVRVVLAGVAAVLEHLVDLFPLEDLERARVLAPEQLGDHPVEQVVGAILEVGDPNDRLVDARVVLGVPDLVGDPAHLGDHVDQDVGELAQRLGRLGQLEQDQ